MLVLKPNLSQHIIFPKDVWEKSTHKTKKAWKELFDEFPDHDFEFQVVFEDEWQNKINAMMQYALPRFAILFHLS